MGLLMTKNPKKWWKKKTSIWHRETDNNEPTNEHWKTGIHQYYNSGGNDNYFDVIADIINNLLKMLKNKTLKTKTIATIEVKHHIIMYSMKNVY